MFTALLVLIYIAFISLGLPDSMLGAGWPVMHQSLGVPLAMEGAMSMITSGGTIISSFLSSKVINRFGTGKVIFVSVMMTAAGLLGIALAPAFIWLCLLCIPLGLGGGAVDAALNNFVALHYKEKHMSWLHCFWGIGATLSPFIMSFFIGGEDPNWRGGYLTVGIIQAALVIILMISLPLWKKAEKQEKHENVEHQKVTYKDIFKRPIVRFTLLVCFCYCSIEAATGLWGSSYLVNSRGADPQLAARFVSVFFLGITVGRLISGFISMKLSGKNMVRLGEAFLLVGILMILQPFEIYICMAGFILVGLGCAPIYPAILHDTPKRVGVGLSQALMGIQMAFAYIGTTFMPPVLGALSEVTGLWIFPLFILFFTVLMIFAVEVTYRKQEKQRLEE